MKLRTTHNSIRIRIRKSELETLKEEQLIEETIQFPMGNSFRFTLSIKENIPEVSASLINHQIEISLPFTEATQWMDTNQVGIEKYLGISNNEQLHILVEKDFPCLDRPEEDKSDTFWELAPEEPDQC